MPGTQRRTLTGCVLLENTDPNRTKIRTNRKRKPCGCQCVQKVRQIPRRLTRISSDHRSQTTHTSDKPERSGRCTNQMSAYVDASDEVQCESRVHAG